MCNEINRIICDLMERRIKNHKEKPSIFVQKTHRLIKELIITFDCDNKIKDLINNSFSVAAKAGADLFINISKLDSEFKPSGQR